ncbi:MAG: PAS domain-containing protein, partial [Proteobacteria bacterium]|nr:PAS domain-containing protein [Pseudomonadota bacterium]
MPPPQGQLKLVPSAMGILQRDIQPMFRGMLMRQIGGFLLPAGVPALRGSPDQRPPGQGAPASGHLMELDKELSVQIQTRLIEQISAYEGRYRRLVDNLHDIVVELDTDGRITFVNRSWSGWLKYPLESARGQLLGAYLSEADAQAVRRIMDNL